MEGFYEIGVHASKDKATSDIVYYVSKDGKHILQGSVFETAENPFKPDLDKLKGITAFSPHYGTQGAPVVIVEFSDFECPYCREEAKTLRANILKDYPKEVHLYHLDLPLEGVHPWARAAAIAGHCVYKQNGGAFWDYYDWIYEHQTDITADNLEDQRFSNGRKARTPSIPCSSTGASTIRKPTRTSLSRWSRPRICKSHVRRPCSSSMAAAWPERLTGPP